MPARLIDDPLGVACVFSDATTAHYGFAGSGNARLAADLAAGLAELIHPHGMVDAASTVEKYRRAALNMVSVLAGSGFSGGAPDLRRPRLAGYWMGAGTATEACTRRILQGFTGCGGVLDPAVAELVAGRAFNPQPFRRPLPPYAETEWARLTEVCVTVTSEAYRAHQQARGAAARGADPRVAGVTGDNLRWLLARTGPPATAGLAAQLGISGNAARREGLPAGAQLFPHLDVVVACRLLFGIRSGIVPDGIDDLVVGDIQWAGDSSILLSYVKGRTAAESLHLPKRAVRLLEQWLDHSELLRTFVPPAQRDQLWIGVSRPGHTSISAGPIDRNVMRPWLQRHDVPGADGRPLTLNRARIRTTHQAMRDKTVWRGSSRATIDPNHTARVEGDNYLSATTPARQHAVESIIEEAQQDMTRRARPPMVIAGEDAAALARDFPQLVASLDLNTQVIAELAGGERDVFTAACADQLPGLHGPEGKPCPARPWVCLLCPLAIFAPRHAGNLLRLRGFFRRQWQVMPAAEFLAVFGPYAQRAGEVLDLYDPAVLATAAATVSEADAGIPLRPEELTR